MEIKRNIKYINRDFNTLRNELIDYSKTYFPNTYNDFTPASTGMLFMEMAAYVGDVLSFYLDNQIQETFIQYARQTENLFSLAYLLGYHPKVTTVATAPIDIYQQVPSTNDSFGNWVPDYSYALQIPPNTLLTPSSNSSINFLMEDNVNFAYSSSIDQTEVSVYQIAGSVPTFYLLKKTRNAISSNINSQDFSFGSPQKFSTITISDNNIVGILDIVDSNGYTWYEVPNLAQETIYDSIRNTNTNDPNLSQDTQVPYLLKLKQVQRRFITRFTDENTLQIQFGSGTTSDTDEEIIPNPDNIGSGLPFSKTKLTTAFSPTNFILTNTYGISPSNTTLTIRYLTGGGVASNVPVNDITNIDTSGVTFLNPSLNATNSNIVFNSLEVRNPKAASGGSDGDNTEEIRKNSLGNFQNQLRAVTQDDYLIRALSMPSKYGAIAKAYATPENLTDLMPGETPSVIQLYVLGYNYNKNLRIASDALKQNLKTYLSEYRVINDSVKIKDAYIINISVNFDIIVLPNYNSNDVLNKCLNLLSGIFDIDNWQINQPIILSDLYVKLDNILGVQTVKNIEILNQTGISLGYSGYAYDVNGATINNVIYPSIDPMIFEVKYPNSDIQGRIVPL